MLRIARIAAIFSVVIGGAAFAQDALTGAPTDAQIAHIAFTANQIDIAATEQVIRNSTNPLVVDFANQMAGDHKTVNEEVLTLVDQLGVTLEDNPTSQSLVAAALASGAGLEALTGAAFDAAYLANEVAYHQRLNAALRDLLIPSAQNPELKALLRTSLAFFTEHQTHAEHLASQLP